MPSETSLFRTQWCFEAHSDKAFVQVFLPPWSTIAWYRVALIEKRRMLSSLTKDVDFSGGCLRYSMSTVARAGHDSVWTPWPVYLPWWLLYGKHRRGVIKYELFSSRAFPGPILEPLSENTPFCHCTVTVNRILCQRKNPSYRNLPQHGIQNWRSLWAHPKVWSHDERSATILKLG